MNKINIVAEKFEKRHSDVLRDIDRLECSSEFRQRNFALSYYQAFNDMENFIKFLQEAKIDLGVKLKIKVPLLGIKARG